MYLACIPFIERFNYRISHPNTTLTAFEYFYCNYNELVLTIPQNQFPHGSWKWFFNGEKRKKLQS